MLRQGGQVEGPLPRIPLVHVVLDLEDFLVGQMGVAYHCKVFIALNL